MRRVSPAKRELHPSERNRLAKLQVALLLAGSDMDQAAAAARALQSEDDYLLARALETALAVCYMRAFTQSSLMTLPAEFVPTGEPDGRYHDELKALRDKVHAHTDKAGGRSASINVETVEDGFVRLAYRDAWLPFERGAIPAIVDFFERQGEHFRHEAAHIQVKLEPYGHGSGTETARNGYADERT
jgi:hypothetical protein